MWQIIHLRDDRYVFVNRNSGKVLDVARTAGISSDHNGANIHQHTWHGGRNQQFTLALGAAFRIIGVSYNTRVLDVSGRSTSDGANIHQWGRHGATSQRWEITKVANSPVESGSYYRIRSVHSGKVLTRASDNNVVQFDWQQGSSNTRHQQWRIVYDDAGYYRLTPRINANRHLTVRNNSTGSGVNIQADSNNGTTGQQWLIMSSSHNGAYRLVSRRSDKSLDISGRSTSNNANIHQWGLHDNSSQAWYIELLENVTYVDRAVSASNINWPNSTYPHGGNRTIANNELTVGDTLRIVTPRPTVENKNTYYLPTRYTSAYMDAFIEQVNTGSSTSISWAKTRNTDNVVFTGTVTSVDESNPDYRLRIRYIHNNGNTYGHSTITRNIAIAPEPEPEPEPLEPLPEYILMFVGDKFELKLPIVKNVSYWSSSNTSRATVRADGFEFPRIETFNTGGVFIRAHFDNGKTESIYVHINSNPIESGEYYRIRPVEDHTMSLAAGNNGNVIIENRISNSLIPDNHQWRINSFGYGTYYSISPKTTTNRISTENRSSEAGANIHLSHNANLKSQRWMILSTRSGYGGYKMVPLHTAKALDLKNGNLNNGTNVVLQDWNDDSDSTQYWRFDKLEDVTTLNTRVMSSDIIRPSYVYIFSEPRPGIEDRLNVEDTVTVITPRPMLRNRNTYYIPTRNTYIPMDAFIEPGGTGSSTSISWSKQNFDDHIVFTGTVTKIDESNPDYRFQIRYRHNGYTYGQDARTLYIAMNVPPRISIPDITMFVDSSLEVTASIANNPNDFSVTKWDSTTPSILTADLNGVNSVKLYAHEIGNTSVTAHLSDDKTQETFNVTVVGIDPLEKLHVNNLRTTYTQDLNVTNIDIQDENLRFIVQNPNEDLIDVDVDVLNSQVVYTIVDSSEIANSYPFDISIRVRYLNEDDIVSEKILTQTIEPRHIVIDIN